MSTSMRPCRLPPAMGRSAPAEPWRENSTGPRHLPGQAIRSKDRSPIRWPWEPPPRRTHAQTRSSQAFPSLFSMVVEITRPSGPPTVLAARKARTKRASGRAGKHARTAAGPRSSALATVRHARPHEPADHRTRSFSPARLPHLPRDRHHLTEPSGGILSSSRMFDESVRAPGLFKGNREGGCFRARGPPRTCQGTRPFSTH